MAAYTLGLSHPLDRGDNAAPASPFPDIPLIDSNC